MYGDLGHLEGGVARGRSADRVPTDVRLAPGILQDIDRTDAMVRRSFRLSRTRRSRDVFGGAPQGGASLTGESDPAASSAVP